MRLIIVESPTKSRTISRFLGKPYIVRSSYGHIRDLPKSKLGIDIKHNFEPLYVIPERSEKIIEELKKQTKKSDQIILATDEDREGEAIAWHLTQALELKNKSKIKRIVFHEITKRAIEEALKNPRTIDMRLVDAQQARRVLDRLVGYKLSPFLWVKVARGLSAGRVQSVAVRLIVEREKEIKAFKPQEYWSIEAKLKKQKPTKGPKDFLSQLVKKNGKIIPRLGIKKEKEAKEIVSDLKKADYEISRIVKKETKRYPYPPYTTSTLQQEAARRLGYSAKRTMMIAQRLYEGIRIGKVGPTGLISYHRTDSLNLSNQILMQAKKFITENFGENYSESRQYKTKTKGAQEAHEAIRPTKISRTPRSIRKFLRPDQYRLYQLIWQRALASQMSPAVFDNTKIEIEAKNKRRYLFRSTGSQLKFNGFLKVYPIKTEDMLLPSLLEKEKLDLVKLLPSQHFTQPPARYNEASLIKTLESEGIGRPSTYAPIISTIQIRDYVRKEEDKCFHPTEIGIMVNDLLVKHFPQIVDIKFTAALEKDLDRVARGKKKWRPLIKEFYEPFEKRLAHKQKTLKKKDITGEKRTKEKCPECGKSLILKLGRFGKFLGCPGYPECKYTRPLDGTKKPRKKIVKEEKCEKCGSPMVLRKGKFGEFLGCSKFPQCDFTKRIEKKIGVKCPKCKKGELIVCFTRSRKIFYGCNRFPKCKYATWENPKKKKSKKIEKKK